MKQRKLFTRLFTVFYNHISKYFSRFLFSFIILLTGISFMSISEPYGSMMLYPVLLTACLMLANYWNGRQLFKYAFSLTAFMLFYIPVQIYDIKLQSMGRVIYFIPLIFSYLLSDTISPNIFGVLLAQLVSTCFGEEENSYVAG